MKITTVFKTEIDEPITGLTPLITINNITDINLVYNVITDGNMIDIGNGFYAYMFNEYIQGEEYSILINANSDIENKYQYDTLQKIDQYDFLNSLDSDIENELGIKQMLRIMFAVLANKSNGGGTGTITFRDKNDLKDRIKATVDDKGNRLSVIIDTE